MAKKGTKHAPSQKLHIEGKGELTPLKKAFAREFVKTGCIKQAYYNAGGTGRAEGRVYGVNGWMNCPHVQAEIARLYQTEEMEAIITGRYVLMNIKKAADIAGQIKYDPQVEALTMMDMPSFLRANDMLGRYCGIFKTVVEPGDKMSALLDALPDPNPQHGD